MLLCANQRRKEKIHVQLVLHTQILYNVCVCACRSGLGKFLTLGFNGQHHDHTRVRPADSRPAEQTGCRVEPHCECAPYK